METVDALVEVAAAQHGSVPGEDPAKARKRSRMVEAATALFIQHGYRKASVHEVARRAGVAKGTLYLYFPTKADLLLAALWEERKRTLSSFLPLIQQEMSGRERLRRWLREVILMSNQSPLTIKIMGRDHEFEAVMAEIDSAYLEQVMDMKVGFLAGLIEDACTPEQKPQRDVLRQRAVVLMATFNSAGFFTDKQARLGLELEAFTDSLCDILIEGLCAPELGNPKQKTHKLAAERRPTQIERAK